MPAMQREERPREVEESDVIDVDRLRRQRAPGLGHLVEGFQTLDLGVRVLP